MKKYRPYGILYYWLGCIEHFITMWRVNIAWKAHQKGETDYSDAMTHEQWHDMIDENYNSMVKKKGECKCTL